MAQISVIVPVYNVESYLAECLESLLKQTYKNFEIICVNDGSTDSSLSILEEYAKKDKRIKVISQKNKGLSGARNTALNVAKGRYVLFLDSDDFLHPQTLQATRYWAQRNKTDITAFLFDKEEKINSFKKDDFQLYDIKKLPNLIRADLMPYTESKARPRIRRVVTTMLFNRKLFKNLRFKEGIYYEDTYLLYSMLKNNIRTTLLPIPFYKYRLNPNSILNSGFTEKHLNSYHILLTDIMDQYADKEFQKKKEFIQKTLVGPVCRNTLKRLENMPIKQQKKLLLPLHKMIFEMTKKGAFSIDAQKQFQNSLHKIVHKIKKNILYDRKRKMLKETHNISRKVTNEQANQLRLKRKKLQNQKTI